MEDPATPSPPYRYWAFISYSRHDSRIARQLVARLGQTAVPATERHRVAGAASHFGPLFLDTSEAAASPQLDTELQQRLRESARLVVVCSPFSAQSAEVAEEIRYFQSIGRSADILCLIASGIPDADLQGKPAFECLPAPLRPLPAEPGVRAPRPLAASLGGETEAEWAFAIEQIVAGLLGITLETLRDRRGRNRRVRAWIAVTVVALLAALGWVVSWAWLLPQHQYATDGVRRWGAWQPVDAISADVAVRRPVSLRFERRGAFGPWTEVRWLDGQGRCATEGPESIVGEKFSFSCSRNKACGIRVGYKAGRVATEIVFDQYEQVVETLRYHDDQRALLSEAVIGCSRRPGEIEVVNFERDAGGADRIRRFAGGDDKAPRPNTTYAFGLQEEQDAQGRVRLRRLLDARGLPVVGAFGYAAVRWRYDASGHRIESTFLGLDEQPVDSRHGYATLRSQVDAFGRRTFQQFFDATGRPVHDESGVYGQRIGWDELGRLVERVHLGFDGSPQVNDKGVAITRSSYPAAGRTKHAYFDAAGRPVLHGESGCAVLERVAPEGADWEENYCFGGDGLARLSAAGWHVERKSYSKLGQLVEEAYFDTAGRPTMCIDRDAGCPHHRSTNQFDERGNAVRSRMFGLDGKPITTPQGISGLDLVYNARNRMQRLLNVDAAGRPVRHRDGGHYGLEYSYDAYGREVERRAVDEKGAPSPPAVGPYATRVAFDERGNLALIESFDSQGRRTSNDGHAIQRNRYDSRGRAIEKRFFGSDEKPTVNRSGWFGQRIGYDAWGRAVSWTRLGADGQPEKVGGVLERRARFNARGHRTQLSLHGSEGGLASGDDGAALWIMELDARGNELFSIAVDPLGQPVVDRSGVAGDRSTYDERGNRVVYLTLGADGAPVARRGGGIAVSVSQFDDRGRETHTFHFDAQARPVVNGSGVFGTARRFDERGQTIEAVSLDAGGRPMQNRGGAASVQYDYDDAGGKTEARYFDAAGKPTARGQAPIVRYRNDGAGRELERSFFDAAGKPTFAPESERWKVIWERDTFGRVLSERSFGVNGSPVNRADTGWHRRELRYGDMGQVTNVTCFDAAGQPVARCSADD